MEMVGAILFAVLLYVITIELWRFVARLSRRTVLQRAGAAGNGAGGLALMESLRNVNLSSKDGQEIESMFDTLDESCPH